MTKGSDEGGKDGGNERGGDEGGASKEITKGANLTAVYPALFVGLHVVFAPMHSGLKLYEIYVFISKLKTFFP